MSPDAATLVGAALAVLLASGCVVSWVLVLSACVLAGQKGRELGE